MAFKDSNDVREKKVLGKQLTEHDNLAPSRTLLEYLREVVTSEGHEILSPICRIPQEVLAEIFMHCIPEDFRFAPTAAPLLICNVCHPWRNIVISTPSFWNKLAFWSHPRSLPPYRLDGSEQPASCYPEDLANTWLRRSGGRSLELFFEQNMAEEHLNLFTPTLLLQFRRCRHLELNIENYNANAWIDFIRLPPGSLIHLESVVLNGLNEAYFGAPVTVLQASPRLQSVTTEDLTFATTLVNGNNSPQFNPSAAPWANLKYLVLTAFTEVGLFTMMLSECSKLEFLRASVDATNATDPITRTVTLSVLKEMYLSIQNGASIPVALNHFRFPALEIFHFRRRCLKRRGKEFSWQDSMHFRTQLSQLRQLSLVGEVGSTIEVLTLLMSVPGLAKLILDINIDYEELLPRLFPMSTFTTSPILFLNHLELHLGGGQLQFRGTALMHDAAGQPLCIFRIRQMLELTSILSLRIFYHRGDPRGRASKELKQQFASSRIDLLVEKIDSNGKSWTRIEDDSRIMKDAYRIDDGGYRCGLMREGQTMKEGQARMSFTRTSFAF